MILGGLTLGGKLNGWKMVNRSANELPQDLSTAVSSLFHTDSVIYNPIWYLARGWTNVNKSADSGNHMLICEEIRPDEEKKIVAVTVNIPIGDFGENATIVEVITDQDLVEGVPAGLELAKKFYKAVERLDGVAYVPVLYIGQQLVKGTNYYVVAQGTVQHPGCEPYALLIKFNEFEGKVILVGIEPLR